MPLKRGRGKPIKNLTEFAKLMKKYGKDDHSIAELIEMHVNSFRNKRNNPGGLRVDEIMKISEKTGIMPDYIFLIAAGIEKFED